LASPLKFDNFTQPVKLRKDPVPIGATVVVSGFGQISTNSTVSQKLKSTRMIVVPQEECAESFDDNFDGWICVNNPRKTGICEGDSGGPAVYNDELVGVTSFGATQCATEEPDVLAKVSYYFDWIQKHMK
jgi:trypsin